MDKISDNIENLNLKLLLLLLLLLLSSSEGYILIGGAAVKTVKSEIKKKNQNTKYKSKNPQTLKLSQSKIVVFAARTPRPRTCFPQPNTTISVVAWILRYLLKSSGKIQDTSKNPTYKQAGVVCRYERKAEKQAGYPAPQLAAARSTSGGARTHRKHINKFSTRDNGLLPYKRERTAKDDDRSSFSFVYKSARRTPCRLASPETFVEVTTSALCASGSSSTSSASSAASW